MEQQEEQRCGRHALNNALAGEADVLFTDDSLKDACDNVVAESLIPDREGGVPSDPTCHEDHMAPSGDYSEQVLAEALRQTMRYSLTLQPLWNDPFIMDDGHTVGAIMNQNNRHWVALKKVAEMIQKVTTQEAKNKPRQSTNVKQEMPR